MARRNAPHAAQHGGGAGGAVSVLKAILSWGLAIFVAYQAFVRFGPVFAALTVLVSAKVGLLQVPRLLGFNSGRNTQYENALLRSDVNPQPITDKHGHEAASRDGSVFYGLSCMQGWRRGMEDAHLTAADLLGDHSTHFFGVFDGHSGAAVANYCGNNLQRFLTDAPSFGHRRYADALREAFVNIDRHLHTDAAFAGDRSGCTANTLLIAGNELYCANAGDSRCVLCRDGKAMPLSNDHKPNLPVELRRIQRARGFVWQRRVNGVLALSRAIGDFSFKNNPSVPWEEQAVTCLPEVTQTTLDRRRDDFVVLACDGIWDVKTNDEVISFVRSRLQSGMGPKDVAERLMDDCLATTPLGVGCDNMSVIIVLFKGDGSS